ncbi:hypothetical protein AOLI_G00070750 [Acnodon oligacanthus]
MRSSKIVWRDEDTVSSHQDASDPPHQAAVTNEHGQWKGPGNGYSLLPTVSMTMVDRPAFTDTYNIDIEKTLEKEMFAFQKRADSLSIFQNLIESSWMSASLHYSILALGSQEAVTFAKPQDSDFSKSALLLYSPRISHPIRRSQHNSLALGHLMHAQHEHELQLTNSRQMFQPGNIPGVLPQENNMGHTKLFTAELLVPTRSSPLNLHEELHARRLVEAHKKALDGEASKTSMAKCASRLERLELKENVSQMDPEGSRTFQKKSYSQREPRQVDTPRRSNENQIGQLHAAPQVFFSTADEEIAERFQALYRFRLLLRCFRKWCAALCSLTKAQLYHQRRILSRALFALQQAVLLLRAQVDTAERRQNALMLAQAFHKWKDCYERRQLVRLDPDSGTEGHIAALRRRLVKPSDAQPLRITYCAWRSHVQGQQIHRAAMIHYHLEVLCKHWLLWRQARLKQRSRSQQQLQAYVWREERLRSRAWTTWLWVWQKREQTTHLHRLVLQRWHQYTQRARLRRLTQTVEQLLSIRTISATFRRWKQAKEMREGMQRLCHLQDRGILQPAFRIWQHGSWMRELARKTQERKQKANLARKQKIFTARSFFLQWRRALELQLLQKHVLVFLFFRRQETSQHSSAVQGELMAVTGNLYGQESFCSVEELCARLVLQTAFYTWRERLKKQQLARWHHTMHVRETMRAKLLMWYGFTQAELSDRVLSFRARLARFHAPHSSGLLNSSGLDYSLDYTDPAGQQVTLKRYTNSSEPDTSKLRGRSRVSLLAREQRCPLQASSPLDKMITRGHDAEESGDVRISSYPHQSCGHPCRGETVALRVLVRLMQPDLSLALSQWRAVLHCSRQMKQRADLFTNSRKLIGLKLAFSTWRIHTEMQRKAVQHRERVLLSSSLTSWKRLMLWRHREHSLQQQAIHLHRTMLIKHCFSAWHTQAVSVLKSGLEQVERRVERRLLSCAFSTWTARGRQHSSVSAFCTRTQLRKVFAAWQTCAQCHKERQTVALSFVQHRLCSAAFSQWRSGWTRQQLASSRAKHTLCLSAKHMLQGWREYTHNRCRMHVHLSVFIEERERTLVRRALLIWQQAVENLKRAQQIYQRALLRRYFSKWLCVSEKNRKLLCISQELQEFQVQQLQQSAFSQWKQRFLHNHSQKQRLRTLISKWTAFTWLRRAARHRDQHVLTHSLQQWGRELYMKRKRRETARIALHIWRQHVLRGRVERERVHNIQKLKLTHTFIYWNRVVRLSTKSRDHHVQKQRRRLLLAWHIHTVSAQRMRYSEACFQYSTELRVMSTCFSLWRRVLIQTQNQQRLLEDRLNLHHCRLTAQIFKHWRAATTQRSTTKKINIALLQKWYVCWLQQRDALQTANQFHAQRQKEATRLVLISWSTWAKEHKGCRQMEEAVRLWLEGRQVCMLFHQWVKAYRQHQLACFNSQKGLLHRSFCAWRAAAVETKLKCQTAEVQLQRFQIQSAFRTWRWAAASHKGVQSLAWQMREADRKRLLKAVFQAWHLEIMAQKKRDVHLSQKFFSLWVQEVQRRLSEKLLQARRRAKLLRRWRYRVVERREQRELTCLHWASWKSQTAVSLLYTQQHESKVLQRAWFTWRKRRIRNKVVSAYTASLNRSLLLKVFHLWWKQALVLGFLPSRAPTRSYSL